jgi:cellulose biosynthesis protein BcsQ
VSKTTLAPQLSAVCKALGWSVVLVDADSQSTSSTWSDARQEKDVPQVPCMTLRGRNVPEPRVSHGFKDGEWITSTSLPRGIGR